MQLNELDQIKRDKSIATGLVNSQQKDLASKDITISKLNRQVDGLKEEINKNVKKILELEERINDPVNTEARLEKDKELFNLKVKLKTTDEKILALSEQVDVIRTELEGSNKRLEEEDELNQKLKADLEQSRQQFVDMQSAERAVSSDLEALKKEFEAFRGQVIEAVFPNVEERPENAGEILIGEVKRILEEKLEVSGKLSELENGLRGLREAIGKGELTLVEMGDEWLQLVGTVQKHEATISTMSLSLGKITVENWELIDNVRAFSEKIVEVFGARSATHRSKSLSEEFEVLRSFEFNENVVGFRDAAAIIFESHVEWLRAVEEMLGCQDNEDCKLGFLGRG